MTSTLRLQIDPAGTRSEAGATAAREVAAIWRRGGTVAFPTETVYGLGANALDPDAVARIFLAKQRPGWDPLIVHVTDPTMLAQVVAEIPPRARSLVDAFWPGPLTLLLPRSPEVPDAVTAGRPLIGVRMPAHPVARALIATAGLPIAAPSANSFGRTSPTTAAHVLEDLDGRIDAVVDGGPTSHGLESTVLDASGPELVVYRLGVVTLSDLERVAGPVTLYRPPEAGATPQSLPSPGVGLRHYAPRARLVLVEGGADQLAAAAREYAAAGDRIGLMLPDGWTAAAPPEAIVFRWGSWSDPPGLAQRLFLGLRELDRRGVGAILCPLPPDTGLGAAMRDRLRKAARPA